MVVLLAPYSESSASDSGAGIVQLHKVSIFKKKIAIVEVVCMYVYVCIRSDISTTMKY